MQKKKWLYGPNKRKEFDALVDLVILGKKYTKSARAEHEAAEKKD